MTAINTTTAPGVATHTTRRPPSQGGFAWLSWLRVAAIAGVVFIHTAGLTAIDPNARSTHRGQLGITLDFASRWAVPVFVMMSGALLLDPNRFRGPGEFLRKRALRLVPAIIVWHVVYLTAVWWARGGELSARDALKAVIQGKVSPPLYFFWIVLGLALVTPVLVPWVASASRRAQVVAGLGATLVPGLTMLATPLTGDGTVWFETAWAWWIPYLGYYLLGYALRDVVLRGARLLPVAVLAVGGCALLTWQWRRTDGLGGALEHYLPAESYYSPLLVIIAVSVFLLAHSLVRTQGLLRPLAAAGPARIGRRLGDATLGVFVMHMLVLQAVLALPVLGGDPASTSVVQLVARCLVVLVVAYVLSLVASRIPFLRRLV